MDIMKIIPSLDLEITLNVVEADSEVKAGALAVPVAEGGSLPTGLDLDLPALKRAGFEPKVGQALAVPTEGDTLPVLVGVGEKETITAAKLRDAAAAFARVAGRDASLAMPVKKVDGVCVKCAASAIVEGIVLARYDYEMTSQAHNDVPVTTITLVADGVDPEKVRAGAQSGFVAAKAASLARDLAIAPPVVLTAPVFGEVAKKVGEASGLDVQVHDKQEILDMGLGGLIGVNRGSSEEPRLIVLNYRPEGAPKGHLAMVGKGIVYDSGGISLKPSNASHAQMKTDMTGAGDVLAAMSALSALSAESSVTGYLMVTDNMPSGSAMQLGDVLTMRNGKTVEVLNTDAEGRLVLADGLALASESNPDAIVDVATLTGLAARTFGEDISALLSNSPSFAKQVEAAGEKTDEPVWELPLHEPYKEQLKSDLADLKNIGGENAGTITAALFLEEFVGEVPWAHLDIAGPSWASKTSGWTNKGPTAWGTRLLLQLALDFEVPEDTK